jgi:hypothetical protein
MVTDSKDTADVPTVGTPTYIVTTATDQSSKKGGLTKKHVLYAVSAVVVIAVILVAILVGMYLFTESQKEIIKFTLKFKGSNDDDVKQDVESDPNDNVVMYHVTRSGQDAYVVNDFNKGMQIVRMSTSDGVNCYVTALNKSSAMDPSYITGNNSMRDTGSNDESTYAISENPVIDRSFLTKKAQDLCKGISLYWVTKQCGKPERYINETDSDDNGRSKRAIYNMVRYNGLPGKGGCCYAYYACEVRMIEYIQGISHTCQTYVKTGTCCNLVARPYCLNYYKFYWKTPGLQC